MKDRNIKRINVLTIAGTDPSGGAGIQADLKTFSALGTYGTSVITGLTAQNTCGVQSLYNINPSFVTAQLDAVFSDLRIDSVKIGMLVNADVVEKVIERLQYYQPSFVVLDTVMFAKNGSQLLTQDAVDAIRRNMLSMVSIITPNLPEAAALLACRVAENEEEMLEQGRALMKMGCQAVLMKGGHLNQQESPDWLFITNKEQRFSAPRIITHHTHGTGCTLSAALAALRPGYNDWSTTVASAKDYLQQALLKAHLLDVGHGIGPLHHFHAWW